MKAEEDSMTTVATLLEALREVDFETWKKIL